VDARSTAVWPLPPYCSTGFGADGCQRNMSVLSLQNNSIFTWNPSTQFPACFNRWPSYRVMTMNKITGIFWFHKMCGQLWQVVTYKCGQLYRFYSTTVAMYLPVFPLTFEWTLCHYSFPHLMLFYFPVITNTNMVAVNFWGAYETSACESEVIKNNYVLWSTFLQNVKQQKIGINCTFIFPSDGEYWRITEAMHFKYG
jgi:hypothetical protein